MSKSNKKTHLILCSHQKFECSVTTLLKWMSNKDRLLFAYYNILRFHCFKKSLQSILKTWQVLKSKKKFFWKISKYRNTVFLISNLYFSLFFFSNYRHRLVLKIPFPHHAFPKISKYRTENLHFLSTGKYYAPPQSYINLAHLQ